MSIINRLNDGTAQATQADIDALRSLFDTFLVEILGIVPEGQAASSQANMRPYEQAVDLLLEMRGEAKARKDWATSDTIRNRMAEIGFDVKDTKNGFEWSVK